MEVITLKDFEKAYETDIPYWQPFKSENEQELFERVSIRNLYKMGKCPKTRQLSEKTMVFFKAKCDDERIIIGVKFFEKTEKIRQFIMILNEEREPVKANFIESETHLIYVG